MVTLIQKLKIEHVLLEPQTKWEFIKYKIKQMSIQFSKNLAKEKRENLGKAKKVNFLIQKHTIKQYLSR